MSWAAILVLAGGAYAFKVLGLVVLGGRPVPARLQRCLGLLPAALLPALIAVQTVAGDRALVVDARAGGVAVAVVAAWRRAPFPLIVVGAAAATAGLRAVGS